MVWKKPAPTLTTVTLAALAALLVTPVLAGSVASGAPAASGAPVAEVARGVQRCHPAVVVEGRGGQAASVGSCVTVDHGFLTVTAPAECRRDTGAGPKRYAACDTSGSWRMSRGGRQVASGALGAPVPYPGPGSYRITSTVRATSTPVGVDVRGRRVTTVTMEQPAPTPTHRLSVTPRTVHPGRTTTLTYTFTRLRAAGDSNARLGVIGEAGSGATLTSADARCGNPLSGASGGSGGSGGPGGSVVSGISRNGRDPHVLDCSLVDLRPGRPRTVTVRVRLGERCSSIVSKAGYWLPDGQRVSTGAMLVGPTVRCVR